MKHSTIIILFMLLLAAPAGNIRAGVAEASIGMENSGLQYDLSGLSGEERKWFRTFLEGTFFTDGWERITENILGHFSSEERDKLLHMLTELGNKVGREWCRDNDIRKIDTAMLKQWGNRLKTTAQESPHRLTEVIRTIDGEVDSLLD